MKTFYEYQKDCAGMSVQEALDTLGSMDAQYDKIIICGQCGNYSISIKDYCEGIPNTVLASSIKPIQFSGGPPDDYFWVLGSLRDLVMDKMMYQDAITEARERIAPAGTKVAKVYTERIPTIRNLGC